MSGAYLQTLAHLAVIVGGGCGVLVGYFFADLIEWIYWRRRA